MTRYEQMLTIHATIIVHAENKEKAQRAICNFRYGHGSTEGQEIEIIHGDIEEAGSLKEM